MSDKDPIFDEEDFVLADMPQPSDMPGDDLRSLGFDDDLAGFGEPTDRSGLPAADDEDGGFDKDLGDDAEAFATTATDQAEALDGEAAFEAPVPPDNDVFGTEAEGQSAGDFPGDPAAGGDEASPGKGKLVRNGVYALAAVAFLGIAYVGYGFVSPLLGGGATVVADLGKPSVPEFDLGEPMPKAGAKAPSLPPPSLPSSTGVADKASLPAGILPASSGDDFAASAPSAAALGTPAPEPSFPATGLQGLPEGPSAVPKAVVDASAFAALKEENESLRRRMDEIASRLAALESRPAPDQAPAPVSQPPAKPQIVKGWTLKGAQGDVAWVDGPGGFRQVRPGTEIDDVGTVKDVTRYEDAWVVVTTAGLILP